MCSTGLPLSSTKVFKPSSHNSFAAQPPLMPLPITIASYVFCATAFELICNESPGKFYLFIFLCTYLCCIFILQYKSATQRCLINIQKSGSKYFSSFAHFQIFTFAH